MIFVCARQIQPPSFQITCDPEGQDGLCMELVGMSSFDAAEDVWQLTIAMWLLCVVAFTCAAKDVCL